MLCSKIFQFKVQSCKLYNNKYMTASTQIINMEIFTFIAVLVFKVIGYWDVKFYL